MLTEAVLVRFKAKIVPRQHLEVKFGLELKVLVFCELLSVGAELCAYVVVQVITRLLRTLCGWQWQSTHADGRGPIVEV